MSISQYWVTVKDFSGVEAAYLVLGIEPEDKTQEPLSSFKHLIRRLKLSFLDSCAHMRYCTQNERDSAIDTEYWNGEDLETFQLMSEQMIDLAVQCDDAAGSRHYESYKKLFLEWLDGAIDQFEQQRFSRDELAWWLDASEIASQFPFRPDERDSPEDRRTKVKDLLAELGGNKAEVARRLGISRQRVQQLSSEKKVTDRNPLRNLPHDPFRLNDRLERD
jgi:hypothetical protein